MQGKTYLTAIFCVVRCILYPGSKIVVCSSTRTQANEVLLKITEDLCKNYDWGSVNLNREISYSSVGANHAVIEFHNGSWIRVVTASDSGRGARSNVLVVDEFRMVDLDVINTVLRRFLTAPRQPGYLSKPEYQHLAERNKEIYMSSCWYQSHWSFEKVKAYFVNMLDDTKKYFVCALPYQIAIKENLLSREQVEDEMSEIDFDPLKFSMEMETLFYGDTDGAFFRYDDISVRRKIKTTFLPLQIYKNHNIKIPELATNEKRILSVDVALMSSKKNNNDASALIINSAIPTKNNEYTSNIVFLDTQEGLTTDELGILVMRYFYQYKCTDLVIDTAGTGLGLFDFVIKDQYDPEYGVTYDALSCCNDTAMAERCKVKGAPKVIWSIKANADFNTKASLALRAAFKNGNVNLPVSEFIAEDAIKKVRGYKQMNNTEKLMLKLVYVQTSLLVNELINLDHEVRGTNIKIREKSGMRKDRYSSLEYNYYVTQQLALQLKPKNNIDNIVELLTIRPAQLA